MSENRPPQDVPSSIPERSSLFTKIRNRFFSSDPKPESTTVKPKSQLEKDWSEQKISRRKLFNRGRTATTAVVGFMLMGNAAIAHQENSGRDAEKKSNEPILHTPESNKYLIKLNEIVAMDPGNDRDKTETEYARDASGLMQIDMGLLFIINKDARIKLRSERSAMRAKGEEGLEPLSADEGIWCRQNEIDHEALGVAKDTRKYALQLLTELRAAGISLTPNAGLSKSSLPTDEQTLPPAEVIAALLDFSGAEFSVVGPELSGKVNKNITVKDALAVISDYWSPELGVEFNEDRIPMRPTGEIGSGIKPLEAKRMNDELAKIGKILLPLDIKMGTILTYLLMVSYGYDSRSTNDKQIAVNKLTDRTPNKVEKAEKTYNESVLKRKTP